MLFLTYFSSIFYCLKSLLFYYLVHKNLPLYYHNPHKSPKRHQLIYLLFVIHIIQAAPLPFSQNQSALC